MLLGKHESSIGNGIEFEYKIQTIFKHPKFRINYQNDIAILKTEKTIEFNDYIRPICLPDPSKKIIDASKDSRASCFVTGWGHTAFSADQTIVRTIRRPAVLQQALMRVLSEDECVGLG